MRYQLPEGYKVYYEYVNGYVTPDRRLLDGNRRCTIAYVKNTDDEDVASAFAMCRPEDNFSKAIGRAIALGRALKAMSS